MRFSRGLKDGLPIALGYVPVAFAFAIRAVDQGFPAWFPILVSATNFTGTGQFIGTDLIAAGASLAVLFATMLIVNIRYALMSVSLAQKLDGNFPLWKRAVLSFGVTDENYAVAVRQPGRLTFPYLTGLMGCSFCGWLGGTALGAGLSALLARVLTGETGELYYGMIMSAFNISLYAMFVAIIIPPARDDRRVLLLVGMSVAASCAFYFVPALQKLPEGLEIVICSIVCTVIVALAFPHVPEEYRTDGESGSAAAADGDTNADAAGGEAAANAATNDQADAAFDAGKQTDVTQKTAAGKTDNSAEGEGGAK